MKRGKAQESNWQKNNQFHNWNTALPVLFFSFFLALSLGREVETLNKKRDGESAGEMWTSGVCWRLTGFPAVLLTFAVPGTEPWEWLCCSHIPWDNIFSCTCQISWFPFLSFFFHLWVHDRAAFIRQLLKGAMRDFLHCRVLGYGNVGMWSSSGLISCEAERHIALPV